MVKRLALVLVIAAAVLVGALATVTATRDSRLQGASPTPGAVSEPVSAGDWTFQVLELERLDSYYAEQRGEVFEPEGVYLVVGVAITYDGTSTRVGDRYVPYLWFEVTSSSGEIFNTSSVDAFAAFQVEETYRDDFPLPPLSLSGVADPGVTHFKRYLFDIPADATGLTLTSHPTAPGEFAIPLPDPDDIASETQWELDIVDVTLHETLGPPLSGAVYEPLGEYLVVDARLTRLQETRAAIDATWFAVRAGDGEPIPVSIRESIELGLPIDAEGGETVSIHLVFDVPAGSDDLALVTMPGAPLDIEIPLSPRLAPPASPTAAPTPTFTPAPTATVTPSPSPSPPPTMAPTATPSPTPSPTATPSPSPTPVPEPGAVRVVTAGEGAALPASATGAVEIILDTSGSMLQPMGDQLRIDVARDVLTGVVTGQLPPGTQTALRVFGTVPGSCETSLAIPLGPLDPTSAATTVAGLQAINEVRTPLGASLDAAAGDLSAVEGPKLIVLITDGEETCGGDPGAVIEALAAQGIDVRVNIVGFAINDPVIEEQLAQWAEQGGGIYVSAEDADDLGPALSQALQPSFDVRDSDGFLVGSGIVDGEAVPVDAGRYIVTVNTSPPIVFERVVVEPSQTTEVVLGQDD